MVHLSSSGWQAPHPHTRGLHEAQEQQGWELWVLGKYAAQ